MNMEIKYVIDLGWPWTPDKAMCACDICGMGMFYKILDEDGSLLPHNPGVWAICVHEFCLEKAKELEPTELLYQREWMRERA